MTIAAFLKQLRATRGPWTLVNGVAIRRDVDNGTGVCPVCAVANQPTHRVSWWSVYRQLRLRHRDALAIVLAADQGDNYDPALRRRVLAATVKR